jgi:CheY-like chemotaxis protein
MRYPPASQPDTAPAILVVDDNRDGLIIRKSLLNELGYRVWTAPGPEQALELMARQKFDVIVTDHKMPRMDGTELIRRMRRVQPGVRIILVSGFVEALGLTEENTGADVVIAKSAGEAAHLTRTVKRLLKLPPARKPPLSAELRRKSRAKA